MSNTLDSDLEKLRPLAFGRADEAEECLSHYHAVTAKLDAAIIPPLRRLYGWVFVPWSLWPFNIQDVLEDYLTTLEKGTSVRILIAENQLVARVAFQISGCKIHKYLI